MVTIESITIQIDLFVEMHRIALEQGAEERARWLRADIKFLRRTRRLLQKGVNLDE